MVTIFRFPHATFFGQIFSLVIAAILCMHSGREVLRTHRRVDHYPGAGDAGCSAAELLNIRKRKSNMAVGGLHASTFLGGSQ